jgi:hypothetical protein
MGSMRPNLKINGNEFVFTYAQNSFYKEPSLEPETLKVGVLNSGSIDSILAITQRFGDSLIYEVNPFISSGGIHIMTLVNGFDTTKFKLHNTSHLAFVEIIEILNPYLPKGKKLWADTSLMIDVPKKIEALREFVSKPNFEQLDWPKSAYAKFLKIDSLFKHSFLFGYECDFIAQYISGEKDRAQLAQVDSSICELLFGDLSEFLKYRNYYLMSIEKPINRFYPITMASFNGVVDRPLQLLLFDSLGNFVNSLQVANAYGESGGCYWSKKYNDSTIMHENKVYEFGVDTTLKADIEETYFNYSKSIIHSNGEIEVIKLETKIELDTIYWDD